VGDCGSAVAVSGADGGLCWSGEGEGEQGQGGRGGGADEQGTDPDTGSAGCDQGVASHCPSSRRVRPAVRVGGGAAVTQAFLPGGC